MPIPVDSPMSLRNDSTQRGPDWWDWSIWLEGPDEELDRVQHVVYRLHPSFPRPVQKVTDRSTKFRLQSSGWGEFTVKADVAMRSGNTVTLERWLSLKDAEGRQLSDSAGAGGRKPTVFISASAIDGELAADLTTALKEEGIDARREQDVANVESNAMTGVDEALRQADGVVAVFSEPRSQWVENEFARGLELRKLAFPIVLDRAALPTSARGMSHFELTEHGNVKALANSIAARLKDHLIQEE